MKGTVFSSDFVKDSNGNLRLLELNTDTGFLSQELANFDFDAKFVVTSYDISVLPKRGDPKPTISITGPYMNKGAAASYIEGLRAGDKVFFENIKAVGPDKKVRPVGTLIFTLN